MPLALLAGSFGRRDPGEEAVLAALIRALPGWEPIVASRSPVETMAAHGCRAIPEQSRIAVGRAIAQADATVLAGGVLDELDLPHETVATAALTRVCALLSAAQALGKPAAVIGVGSPPFGSRRLRALARAMVKRADLLVLRDASSARILAAAGAEAPFRGGADPAWALFEFGSAGASADNRGGGESESLVAILDSEVCDEPLAARLAVALGSVTSTGARLRLQPWRAMEGRADDVRLAGVVAGRIPGPVEVMEPPATLAEAARAVGGARLVVALRQHALIAAAVAGVPAGAGARGPGFGDLARRLPQPAGAAGAPPGRVAGVPAVAVARDPGLVALARRLRQPAVAASAPPERLADAIRRSLDQPAASRSAVQGQVSSAEEGFRLLRLLLSRGRSEEANDLTGLPLEPAFPA